MVSGCLFCRIVAGDAPAFRVLDGPQVVAFLDTRPVFKGHTLVVTRHHIPTLAELPDDLLVPLYATVRLLARAVVDALGCQGSFVATNNVVSQSVPHLHVHVVPRTKGDGLRGFFWPRTGYADDTEATSYAQRVADAVAGLQGAT